MKLLTKELEEKFKAQGDTGSMSACDIKVIAKYFNPVGAGTWFATDWIPADGVFFGYANIGDDQCAELGYFSLQEMEDIRLPFGMKIERDLHFGEHSLQEVMDKKGHL